MRLNRTRMSHAQVRTNATAVLATSIACVAAFKGLNESVTPPALPVLQEEFQAPASTIAWVLTGVLLTGTIATPIVSRLGEVWDKRRALLVVLTIVALGTLTSALSSSISMLIAGQLLQGIGLSTVPLAIGIIRDTQTESRTKSANGFMVAAIFASTAAGTMIAGPIADYLSYRWLFWVPFVALTLCFVAVWVFVPRSPRLRSGERPSLDVVGSLLLAAGLACVLLALTFAPQWGWLSPKFVLLTAAGLLGLLLFIRRELTVDQPLVDIRLMGSLTVVAASGMMFLAGFSINATLISVPLQMQLPDSVSHGLGRSATATSLVLVSAMLMGLTAPLISFLDRKVGPRFASAIGPIAIMFGAAIMIGLGERGSIVTILAAALFVNFGISVSMTQSLNLVVSGVPAEKVTEFNGLNFAIQAVAGTIGAQVCGAVLTGGSGDDGATLPWSAFSTSWAVQAVIATVALLLVLAARTRPRTSQGPAPVLPREAARDATSITPSEN
ncbi:MFS transporter [Rhodococcus sp. BP-252]|uniref:MFS transporter n=1 Tax=Nocardiaceae TaxID=85025 RepID=UPI0008389C17|nr:MULTISPECIES: MFS transporter [Rhodococcus]MBY6410299.1 MFS transporter [Rhodococcus sp. BP-320]MBY6416181.1 MFS transporter [Rhodococcus sp. BP-321]MBY6420176.1 MFS transporter [Rhodococcus sp. BP-324]MBY6424855.1 MFS transporter [Rhodococcus sp. BP-323]MBY6430439.1 MFS transporter [Rhodococcus sp. BP-322]